MNIFDVQVPEKVIYPLFIILGALIVYLILNIIINSKIKINTKASKHEQRSTKTLLMLIQNIIKTFVILVAILSILQVFGVNTSALIASVGALSLVVGLAFQDLLKDYLVGALIIIEKQFAVGEIVQINGIKGEVIGLTLRTTKIKSFTGEINIIPNRAVGTVTNFSLCDALVVVHASVSYESNIKKVDKVLNELSIKLRKDISEIKGEVLVDGVDSLNDSAIIYRISAPSSAKNVAIVKRKILKQIKLTFDENNISIPYPQVEVHYDK